MADNKLLSGISGIIFPDKCPLCGRIFRKRPGLCSVTGELCDSCAGNIFTYASADELPHAALPYVLKLYVPFRYSGDMRRAVLRYKFGGENWLSGPFAEMLFAYLRDNGAFGDCELITFVPVSGKRLAVRGYDQSRLIAKRIGELSGIPVRCLLERSDSASGMAS